MPPQPRPMLLASIRRCAAPGLLALALLGAWAQVQPKPMVIAHRGASADAPENTLAAYALAVEYGARLTECDVYLSSGGVPVLFHGGDLKRTSSGNGPIVAHSLA